MISVDGFSLRGRVGTLFDASRSYPFAVSNGHFSGFTNGVYLVYTLTGHVKVRFTNTNASYKNAVLSGIFMD